MSLRYLATIFVNSFRMATQVFGQNSLGQNHVEITPKYVIAPTLQRKTYYILCFPKLLREA